MKGKLKIKIGCLGPEGTFSHWAGIRWRNAELICLNSFAKLFEAIEAGEVDEIIVPIGNFLIGGIGQVMDLVIKGNGHLHAVGELIMPVRQNLIAVKKIPLNNITSVVSINEAINQCGGWLKKNLPNAKIISVESTAAAVKDLKKHGKTAAAIGPCLAAEIYNRHVIVKDIHDNKDNATRFLVLSREKRVEEMVVNKKYKTSIILKTKNKPGALVDVLLPLKVFKINMSKIESRPSKVSMHESIFWIDIDGHQEENKVKEVIKNIGGVVVYIKVLGSYPKARRRK